MRRKVTPQEAGRQFAYDCWIDNTMPMVTVVSTLDVTRVIRYSKKHKKKLNMLMCYCIVKAASKIKEMYTFLDGKQLFTSERMTIQTIIAREDGELRFCDLPYCDTLEEFNQYYENNTRRVKETGEHIIDGEGAPIYTSCVTNMYLDVAVNQFNDKFTQPFLAWGKYRKVFLWRYKLPISMQFHHVQMDGRAAGEFYNNLQSEFDKLH